MVFSPDCDPNALNATPSTAARSAAQLSDATTPVLPVTKTKSAKSSKIPDQLELERLKQQNLQLELQLLSQKEKLGAESLLLKQDKISAADSRGQLLNDQSQEKILASLMIRFIATFQLLRCLISAFIHKPANSDFKNSCSNRTHV